MATSDASARVGVGAVTGLPTRLGEVTSFLTPAVTPTRGWIHVDTDATAFAAAFPGIDGLGVVSDAGAFVAALAARAEATGWRRARPEIEPPHLAPPPHLEPRDG